MGFSGDMITRTPLHASSDVVYLEEDLVYVGSWGDRVVMPKGMPTDGASVPRPLRPFVPKRGAHTIPSALHDRLYQVQEIEGPDGLVRPISRKDADGLYRRAMRHDSETSWLRIFAIYWGLRVGGWVVWNRYARAIAEESPEHD